MILPELRAHFDALLALEPGLRDARLAALPTTPVERKLLARMLAVAVEPERPSAPAAWRMPLLLQALEEPPAPGAVAVPSTATAARWSARPPT